MSALTDQARDLLGPYVQKAGKTFIIVRFADVFDEGQTVKITLANLAEFFATQACNFSSGCRTLAGITGDWRPVSELANLCLEWFKRVNRAGMRRAGRKVGLTPKF